MPRNILSLAALLAIASAVVVMLSGCGGKAEQPETNATTTPAATATSTSGTAVPDIFMTFEGRRYRLVNVESAEAPVDGEAVLIGETDDIDIDHDVPVKVYRSTEGNKIYTFPSGDGGLPARGVTLPDRCGRCGIRIEWGESE